jgi:acetyltransferase-like isoleucine patch superfamily enzyme
MSYPYIEFKVDQYGRKIAEDVYIASGVHLGTNITIYPGVRIESGASIMDNAVLGRIPLANKTMNRQVESKIAEETIIGESAIVGTGAVIYTGCHLGKNVLIGDLTDIREYCDLDEGVTIGRGTMILDHCKIGKFTRIHDLVHLLSDMVIEEHVFIAVCVAMANDDNIFLTRFGLAELKLRNPIIRKYAVIGSGVTLVPGVEIGMGSLVAAGAVVTKDVDPWTIVAGVPAKHLRDIPDEWRQKVLDKFETPSAE